MSLYKQLWLAVIFLLALVFVGSVIVTQSLGEDLSPAAVKHERIPITLQRWLFRLRSRMLTRCCWSSLFQRNLIRVFMS